jgi:hypothetical protein
MSDVTVDSLARRLQIDGNSRQLSNTSNMNDLVLQRENDRFAGSGGCSAECAHLGLRPAFMDQDTRTVYPSRFKSGALAPIHLLDGLPPEVVTQRNSDGRVVAVKPSVVAGFVRDGEFYSREAATRLLSRSVGNAADVN